MKVLMITSNLDKGGVGSVVMTLYSSLAKRGIDCDLTYYEDARPSSQTLGIISSNGDRAISLKRTKDAGLFAYVRQVRDICLAGHYDAVHIHNSLLSWLAAWGARDAGVDHRIAHAHGNMYFGLPRWVLFFLEPIGRILNRHFCTGLVTCCSLSGRYEFGKDFVFVPNYRSWDFIDEHVPLQPDPVLRRDHLTLIYAGGLDGVKNARFLIPVLSELLALGLDARLLLVGQTSDPIGFEELISKFGLAAHVELLGFRDDCIELVSQSDFFVTASTTEGMSMALIEAQMLGKHCFVSSSIPPESNLGLGLYHTIDGYDPAAWARSVRDVALAPEPSLRRDDIRRQLCSNCLDEDAAICRLMDVYHA